QVIAFSRGRYRILGETLDLALGNCLDRFARVLQIPNDPSPGYNIEQLATRVGSLPLALPHPFYGVEVWPQSLALPTLTKPLPLPKAVTHGLLESGEATVEDLCFSLQETAFSMVAEVTERALALCRANRLLLVGGVAC
ncbi:OSGEP threonylcarbamoyltransferase, partial [Rhinopomastus cyanomelas]|nr:OSGEP threonylcarbamoyltransferase [Rhinopomastus cyanomelas]